MNSNYVEKPRANPFGKMSKNEIFLQMCLINYNVKNSPSAINNKKDLYNTYKIQQDFDNTTLEKTTSYILHR